MMRKTLHLTLIAVLGLGSAAFVIVAADDFMRDASAQQEDAGHEATWPIEKTYTDLPPLIEGRIWSVSYDSAEDAGKVQGMVAVDHAEAVPGQGGSWNEDIYGELYPEFLYITKPHEPNWGVTVIPVERLRKIHWHQPRP